MDYIRTPIPDAALLRTNGTEVTLQELTRERAALLLFVQTSSPARDTALTLLPAWRAQLERVDILPVLRANPTGGPTPSAPGDALFDPDTRVSRLFSGHDATSTAVLLGADGLLAGGPVSGTDAIAQFVTDIADALAQAGLNGRRALVTFVEDGGHLVQQLLALRQSWLALASTDTDLVAMGPTDVLERLPDDLVKIPQRPACDDPVWRNYRYVNSLACLNAAGSERLLAYSHLLRTDVDTFIFPGWDHFRPSGFRWGTGGYAGRDEVRDNIAQITSLHGMTHRGHTNVGSTWYGPTDLVRRTAAFTEMLTKYMLTTSFADGPGEWPGWYQGVSTLYAGEIAVNHCVPEGAHSPDLDFPSTSRAAAKDAVHVHCWHTNEDFSKHRFMSRGYSSKDVGALPPGSVARLSLEYSLASLLDLDRFHGRT